jgi:hypothetical protein
VSARRSAAERAAAAAAPPPAERLAGRPAWQQHALAVVALGVALAAVLPEIALRGQVFASPDYDSPSYFGAAGRAAQQAGELPLWNPYLFLGMPSFASLTYTPWVHPPSEILAALGRLPLTPPLLWLLVYYVAAGFGLYLLLRDLGAGFWPALLGGVAFMLSPHLVSMGVFGHGSKLASVAYLPYLVLLARGIRRGHRWPMWVGLFGIVLGLQLLRGHPQIAFYGAVMIATFAVVEVAGALRRGEPRREIGRFVGGLAAGAVLGAVIASALLLPVRAYAPESIRGASETGGAAYEYATNWSFSPREIATLWLPSAAGFGEATYVGTMPFTNFPNYIGQASVVFGIAALVLLRGGAIVFLVALSLLALAVSFGRNLPLVYDLFYKFLPYFDRFRVPVMILVLQQLCAAVLLGLGFAALQARLPRGLEWRRPPAARDATRLLVAAAALAVALVILAQPWSSAVAARVGANPRLPPEARAVYAEVASRLLQGDALRVGALLVLHAAAVWGVWRRRLPVDIAGAACVVLTAVDLGAVDRKMVAPQKTWPGLDSRVAPARAQVAVATPIVRWLEAQPKPDAAPLRILPSGPGFMDNRWMAFGIASAGGYHPAKLARFEHLVETRRQTIDPRLLDLFAVQYVVVPERMTQSRLQPAYEGPDGVAYANPRALPRAWVTGRWERTQPGAACRARLLADDFPRDAVVLLEADAVPLPDPTATGTARITGFRSNRVELEVTATAPAILVVAEAYHSGWRARVDGRVAPVWPADCVLRAVPVPPGTSHVELRFVDPALGRGVWLSFAGLAVALGLVVAGARRAPRSPAAAS